MVKNFGCMKKIWVLVLMIFAVSAMGQSRSVEKFRNDYKPDTKLFFYKSTLQMYARVMVNFAEEGEDIPDIASMVDGIDKIKFFIYERSRDSKSLFAQLKKDVLAEDYEEVIAGRFDGNQLEMLMKERRGNPVGFVVFVEADDQTLLMDIDGVPDVNKLLEFSRYASANSKSFNMLRNAFD